VIIGCDPGLTGAFVVIDESGALLSVTDMPVKTKRVNAKDRVTLDEEGIQDWLRGHRDLGADKFIIERVGGFPGQGAPAAFNFGYGYGILLSASRMLGYDVEQVTPQVWKGKMIRGWARSDKAKVYSIRTATRAFGTKEPWRRQKDHGRAEAALIALYGLKHVWDDKA